MTVPAEERERRLNVLSAGVRGAGLRLTQQRVEVLRVIAASESHPDVDTIYASVRRRMPTISLDTVYRTLATLADRGLIERVTATPGPARYDGNPFQHHHFVCRRCGLVRDIDDTGAGVVEPTTQTLELGDVELVRVEFRGLCRSCLRTSTRAASSVSRPLRMRSAPRPSRSNDSHSQPARRGVVST